MSFDEYKKYIRSQGVKTKEELDKATNNFFRDRFTGTQNGNQRTQQTTVNQKINAPVSNNNTLLSALPTPMSMAANAINTVRKTVKPIQATTLPELAKNYNLNDPEQLTTYLQEGIKLQRDQRNKAQSSIPYSPLTQKTYATGDKDSWLGYTGNAFMQTLKDTFRNYGNSVATTGAASYGQEAQSEFNKMAEESKKYYAQGEESKKVAQAVNDTIDKMRKGHVEKAYQYVSKNAQASQDEWAKLDAEYGGLSDTQRKWGKWVGGSAQMLPAAAVGFATGGAGLMGSLASNTVLYAGAKGAGVQEAIANGASVEQAEQYGQFSALTELMVEKISGGIAGIKPNSGLLKAIPQAVDKYVSSSGGRWLLKTLESMGGEGAEEVLSGYITPLLQRAIYDPRAEMPTLEETVENFMGGAIASGPFSGFSNATDIRRNNASTSFKVWDDVDEFDANRGENSAAQTGIIPTGINMRTAGERTTITPQEFRRMNEKDQERTIRIAENAKELGVAIDVSDYITRVANAYDIEVEFSELPAGKNGLYKDGKIIMSPKAERPANEILKHEVTHHMEGSKYYGELQKFAEQYWNKDGDFQQAVEVTMKLYEDAGIPLKREEAVREVVADTTAELLSDEDFLKIAQKQNAGMVQHIYDWIKTQIQKIKHRNDPEFKELLEVQKMYERVMKTAKDRGTGDTSFSIKQDADGNRYVSIDQGQNIFDNAKPNQYPAIAKREIQKRFAGKTYPLGEDDLARINAKTAGKYAYAEDGRRSGQRNQKMRASTELDNLLSTAKHIGTKDDDGRHDFASLGWDYFETEFEVGGKRFSGILNVGTSEKGRMLYDLTNIKEVPQKLNDRAANGQQSNHELVGDNSSTNNISKTAEKVNDTTVQFLDDEIAGNHEQQYNNKEEVIQDAREISANQKTGSANSQRDVTEQKAAGSRDYRSVGKSIHEGLRNDERGSGNRTRLVVVNDPKVQNAFLKKNIDPVSLRSGADATAFYNAIVEAKTGNDHGAYVTAYDVDDYQGYNLILSDDQGAGVAVKPDGDIISVFKNPRRTQKRRAVSSLLVEAIGNGGKKLDNFDGGLSSMYAYHGFVPVSRCKFDREFAPEGWNYARDGEPDIIFWVHNGDGAETVAQKIGEYPAFKGAESIPLFDSYDEAMDYRDEVLRKREQSDDGQKSIGPGTRELLKRYAPNTERETPMDIASLKKEDANTTPKLQPSQSFEEKKAKEGDRKSKFAKSVQNSGILSDEVKQIVRETKGINTYDRITNRETLEAANEALDMGGQKYVNNWFAKDRGGMDALDITTGIILLDRYQAVGDYESAVNVIQKLRSGGTQAGQAVQAFSLLSRLTPEGMLVYAQKSLDAAFEEMVKKRSAAWIEANQDKFKLNAEDAKFISEKTLAASKLPDGRDKQILIGEIAARIQNKIPASGQALKAMNRISLLLNVPTNVRNILGNAVMLPRFLASDFIAAGIDKKIGGKTGERTKGLYGPQWRGFKKGLSESFDDFRRGINTRLIQEGGRFELPQGKSFNDQHTGPLKTPRNALARAMNGLDRLTTFALDAGDRPFFEFWFMNSIEGQKRANLVKEPTAAMIQIAMREALQRTWQDTNRWTNTASSIRKLLNVVKVGRNYGLGDVVLKFCQTPANLAKAMVDFSPIGAIKALVSDGRKLKSAMERGKTDAGYKDNVRIQQHEYVKNLANGITGTLFMAAWLTLMSTGVVDVSGKGDDDKDVADFMKNVMGIQPYSIKLGGKRFDYTWAQPIGSQLAALADIKSLIDGENPTTYFDGDDGLQKAGNYLVTGLEAVWDTFVDQSFMQGVQNLFESDNFIVGLLESSLGDVSSFVPAISNQAADIMDDTARSSYNYKDPVGTAVNRIKARIPGQRETLAPQVDVLGREVSSTTSPLEVLLSPAKANSVNSTKEADEMYRLYEHTKDAGAIAPKSERYYKSNKTDKMVYLDAYEYADMQKTMGEIATDGLDALLGSSAYKRMKDEDKVEVVKKLYSYAKQKAKVERGDYTYDKTNQKVADAEKKGINPAIYFLVRAKVDSDGNGSVTQKEAKSVLDSVGSLTQNQKRWMWQSFNSSWKDYKNPY